MMKTQKSLFSAIIARIAKKFKTSPENRETIVKGRWSTRTLTKGNEKMTKQAKIDAPVVAPVAEIDGPVEIHVRNGKKGPGTLVVIVPNKADGEIVKGEIAKTAKVGTMVFTKPYQAPVITPAIDWLKAREAIVARQASRSALIATLKPEQLALLGITAE
jgi:hypothetical protein